MVHEKPVGPADPRRLSREATRDLAVERARTILAAEGLDALTARRLATEVGCSVGTLYNLFENIEALVLELNLETLSSLERHIAHTPLSGDPVEATLALARRYLAFTLSHRLRWMAVLTFKADLDDARLKPFQIVIQRMVAQVEQALAPLFGADAAAERRLIATTLWSSLEGVGSLSGANSLRMVAELSPETIAEALIRNLLAGVVARRDQ